VAERLPPALPPEDRRWENPWPAILTGLLALIIGGVIGYAIGHNGETASERSAREGGATRTVTNTTTVVRPKVVLQTNTVTASTDTQTPAPANQANEERRTEAETNLRRAERENQELKRKLEEVGAHP
jgi:hypothetical protein